MKAMLNKFERFKEKKVQDLHTFLRKKMRKGKVKKKTSNQTTFTRNQRKYCTNTILYVYKLSMRLLAL